MKINGRKKLPMEAEFIAHELNTRLGKTGEYVMRVEIRSDHPPTCAARGLELGAKVAGM
jgi:hypothetical protein